MVPIHQSIGEERQMDQKLIAKQMIQFNKTAIDNSFKAMNMVYEQNEKIAGVFMEQATWLPEEGKKAIKDWMATYKSGSENFKSLVDESYSKVDSFFSDSK
jgi:hypothetical protein